MSTPKTIPSQTMEYISMVTDPYHDRNLRVSGFPDGNTMVSAIKRYAKQYSIACPFNLAAGETWSFHIFTTPLHFITPFLSCDIVGNVIPNLYNALSPSQVGPVNVLYIAKNSAGTMTATQFVPLGGVLNQIENGEDSRRTVSLAFELHNTTAELYKAGSLTTYRLNSSGTRSDYQVSNGATPPVYSPITFTHLTTIPSTLSEANQLPNSRTWEASKGIYSVTLPSPTNTYSAQLFQNIGLSTGRDNNSRAYLIYSRDASQTITCPSWSPASCTGVMSSEFPDRNQTFTLDYRQVLEYAPTPQSDNLPYATTSPECDLLFIKLYKRMINSIEPGVPVGFNSAGEWFRRILALAKEQLPNLIHLLPAQYKTAATAALPAVNTLVDKVISKLQPRDAPQQPKAARKKQKKLKPDAARRSLLMLKAKSQRFIAAKKQ